MPMTSIGVSSLFLDASAWELVFATISEVIAGKSEGNTIRAWVPACSTGAEAYSLAFALHECIDRHGRRLGVQIFGTDHDPRAIATARRGIFSPEIANHVSSQRLARFFRREANTYRLEQEIRRTLTFGVHDLTRDPPFAKLDLLSCRGLSIERDPALATRLFPVFHRALREGGMLFGAWDPAAPAALFAPVDERLKIFRRRNSEAKQQVKRRQAPVRRLEAAARPSGRLEPGAEAPDHKLRELAKIHHAALDALATANEKLKSLEKALESAHGDLFRLTRELRERTSQLSTVRSDLKNVLSATDIAAVFVDANLKIRGQSDRARALFNLGPSDSGRTLRDLATSLDCQSLIDDSLEVLLTLAVKETEVLDQAGGQYLARIQPYRTIENVIDGLVLTFVDVTIPKSFQEKYTRLLRALDASPAGVFGQDEQPRITWASRTVFGRKRADILGKTDAEPFEPDEAMRRTDAKRNVPE